VHCNLLSQFPKELTSSLCLLQTLLQWVSHFVLQDTSHSLVTGSSVILTNVQMHSMKGVPIYSPSTTTERATFLVAWHIGEVLNIWIFNTLLVWVWFEFACPWRVTPHILMLYFCLRTVYLGPFPISLVGGWSFSFCSPFIYAVQVFLSLLCLHFPQDVCCHQVFVIYLFVLCSSLSIFYGFLDFRS
jgi:hypothetical protein